MNLQDQIYDLFINAGCDRNENQNKVIHDKYIIKRGHSPNGWYSLSNKDRFRLQMTPVGVKWEYVQVNDTMFLWLSLIHISSHRCKQDNLHAGDNIERRQACDLILAKIDMKHLRNPKRND